MSVKDLPKKLRRKIGRRSRPIKVFHGPSNIGGIGYRLSRLQRARGIQSDFWSFNPHPRKPECDVGLHLAKDTPFGRFLLRAGVLLFCLKNYDVFHFYAAKTILPRGLDLPILKLFRKRIVMTYCGSDVRLFCIDKDRNAFPDLLLAAGYTAEDDARKIKRLKWQSRWIDRVTAPRDMKAPAVTAFPPERVSAVWINNIDVLFDQVDEAPAAAADAPLVLDADNLDLGDGRGPLIIHAPTSVDRKGTAIIEAAIQALPASGLVFSYKRVEGMTHVEAMRWIRRADIIADQLVIGSFGNVALEGMRLGKVVCVYVMDDVLDDIGEPMPIVNINPDNIRGELERLVSDDAYRASFAQRGADFVRRRLDLEKILDEVESLYVDA